MQPKMKHLIFTSLRRLGRMALQLIITGVIVVLGLTVISKALGLPVLSPSELFDKFKNVSKLGEILS